MVYCKAIMLGRMSKKIILALLTAALVMPSSFFTNTRTAKAVTFGAATQSVISAGIGCAASSLIKRKLSGKLESTIANEAGSSAGLSTSVSVHDSKTAENTKSIAEKENCLKKVARAASQTVLRQITKDTVTWINTGFNGQPLFVRNTGSFFKSIRDREVSGLAAKFADRNKYPFGESFIRGYVQTVQSGFDRNAQYSLNQSLGGYTSTQYYNNFNLGGWSAWKAQGLPQNNPVGFSLLASKELSARLAGTEQSVAQDLRDELQQGMGFLSQKICVDPEGYTPPANPTASILAIENLEGYDAGNLYMDVNLDPSSSTIDMCRRYETTTPGGVVSNRLTSALDIPKENLLLAPEDLDASLQAVFDALLSQLFKKGVTSLADLATGNTDDSPVQISSSGGYGNNSSTATQSSTSESSQWFSLNPGFDITNATDLQKVIDTQRAYITLIADNPAITAPNLIPTGLYPAASSLYASQKGQNYWLAKIIPEIYQLDYCIPGPHPGWENEAQTNLLKLKSEIVDTKNLNETALGRLYNLTTLGLGTQLINFWTNIATSGNVNADDIKHIKYYGTLVEKITGIRPEPDNYIGSYEKFMNILDVLFDRFIATTNARFHPANLPSVTGEARVLFTKINGYQSILTTNQEDLIALEGAVRRLETIKAEVTSLSAQRTSESITQSNYENLIAYQERAFARIAPDLVTENDVAGIQDQTQQLIDDIVYIHNDLIKGPAGCEADVPNAPAMSRVRAWPYPQPHYYDYPQDSAGSGAVDLGSLGKDQVLNNLIGGMLRSYSTYYPFMEYAYFGTPASASLGSYQGWFDVHITDIMNFDIGEVSPTVGWFEAKIGPLW